MFVITNCIVQNKTLVLVGQTEEYSFICNIISVEDIANCTNDEGNIYISDNRGGFYNIKMDLLNPELEPPDSRISPFDFNYNDYGIPAYIWCIVTGMIMAEL